LLDLVPRYSFENTTDNERIGTVELTASSIREDASKAFLACSAYVRLSISPENEASTEELPAIAYHAIPKSICGRRNYSTCSDDLVPEKPLPAWVPDYQQLSDN
jgi:hypothetical protein